MVTITLSPVEAKTLDEGIDALIQAADENEEKTEAAVLRDVKAKIGRTKKVEAQVPDGNKTGTSNSVLRKNVFNS